MEKVANMKENQPVGQGKRLLRVGKYATSYGRRARRDYPHPGSTHWCKDIHVGVIMHILDRGTAGTDAIARTYI